jgi:hypothetical protein
VLFRSVLCCFFWLQHKSCEDCRRHTTCTLCEMIATYKITHKSSRTDAMVREVQRIVAVHEAAKARVQAKAAAKQASAEAKAQVKEQGKPAPASASAASAGAGQAPPKVQVKQEIKVKVEADEKNKPGVKADAKAADVVDEDAEVRVCFDDGLSFTCSSVQPSRAKVIIFSQWTSLLDICEANLRDAGIACLRFDGDVRNIDVRSTARSPCVLCMQHGCRIYRSPTRSCRILLTGMPPCCWSASNPAVSVRAIAAIARFAHNTCVCRAEFDMRKQQNGIRRLVEPVRWRAGTDQPVPTDQ